MAVVVKWKADGEYLAGLHGGPGSGHLVWSRDRSDALRFESRGEALDKIVACTGTERETASCGLRFARLVPRELTLERIAAERDRARADAKQLAAHLAEARKQLRAWKRATGASDPSKVELLRGGADELAELRREFQVNNPDEPADRAQRWARRQSRIVASLGRIDLTAFARGYMFGAWDTWGSAVVDVLPPASPPDGQLPTGGEPGPDGGGDPAGKPKLPGVPGADSSSALACCGRVECLHLETPAADERWQPGAVWELTHLPHDRFTIEGAAVDDGRLWVQFAGVAEQFVADEMTPENGWRYVGRSASEARPQATDEPPATHADSATRLIDFVMGYVDIPEGRYGEVLEALRAWFAAHGARMYVIKPHVDRAALLALAEAWVNLADSLGRDARADDLCDGKAMGLREAARDLRRLMDAPRGPGGGEQEPSNPGASEVPADAGMRIERRADGEWLVNAYPGISGCGAPAPGGGGCTQHLDGEHLCTGPARDGAEPIYVRWPIESAQDTRSASDAGGGP